MSENIDDLKEFEKKKLDAAYDVYNGVAKEPEMEAASPAAGPAEVQRPPRPREGSGNPNLGVLLITAGIVLFLIFSGIIPRFGIWGWLITGWLIMSVMKGGKFGCRR